MSNHEKSELERLTTKWVSGTATKSQILRCMELERMASRVRKARRMAYAG
jgi:hypothetical protein